MELMVTMALSVIIIGITYTSYQIISHSYQSFTLKNDQATQLLSLQHLLEKDFAGATEVMDDSAKIILQVGDRRISYEVDTGFIVRIGAGVDTFKFKTKNLILSPCNNSGHLSEKLIEGLSFTLIHNHYSLPFDFHKTYSSEELLKKRTYADR